MNCGARGVIVLCSLLALVLVVGLPDAYSQRGGGEQSARIRTAPARTVVLSRVAFTGAGSPFKSFTSIEVLGADLTAASGINNRGQIVGGYHELFPSSGTGWHGFLLDKGNFSQIDIPGATETSLSEINLRGQMIGIYRDGAGVPNGFLLDGNSVTLIDVPGSIETGPRGINDEGEIVGAYVEAADGPIHGFLLRKGVYTPIDVPGAEHTWADAINERGQIVGNYMWTSEDGDAHYAGFVLDGDVYTTVDIPGAFATALTGISPSGRIVGFSDGWGFIHQRGVLIPLNLSTGALPTDINAAGKVVGEYVDETGQVRGFLLDEPTSAEKSIAPARRSISR